MRDLACERQLALETTLLGDAGIVHHVGPDHFDRDRDAELGVPRLIDGAHTADAERANDVIARPEYLSRGQRFGLRLRARLLGP